MALLRECGERFGFDVAPAPLAGDGERWSSTSVRRALATGDLEAARAILGHAFTLRGAVVHGDQRGAALGFPTANLALGRYQQLPEDGVYAGAARVGERWWPAAVSVGTRPHFYDQGELLVEVYVLDFVGDLYAATLDVAFLARLRGQWVFASDGELVERIERDVAETRRIREVLASRRRTATIEFGQRR